MLGGCLVSRLVLTFYAETVAPQDSAPGFRSDESKCFSLAINSLDRRSFFRHVVILVGLFAFCLFGAQLGAERPLVIMCHVCDVHKLCCKNKGRGYVQKTKYGRHGSFSPTDKYAALFGMAAGKAAKLILSCKGGTIELIRNVLL
jgi:hypothetical protein